MSKYILFLLFICLSFQLLAQLQVNGTYPKNQNISTPVMTTIAIEFKEALDLSSVNDTTFRVFGRWSGVAKGTFALVENDKRLLFVSEKDFMHGEEIIVKLSKTIHSVAGNQLQHGYAFSFWTMTTPSSIAFKEIARLPIRYPGELHIQSYGAYAGDLNQDGWSDLAIPNEQSNDVRVFYNDGTGAYQNFEQYPLENGAKPSANEGADFNLDGNIDFAVANTGNDKIHVLMGNNSGRFEPAKSYDARLGVRGLAITDFNWDGYDDIITANRDSSNLSLLENQKNGAFEYVRSIETGTNGETAIVVADANNDGILDLFVGAFSSRDVMLLLGDTLGGWALSAQHQVLGNPWMMATGDLNGDGNADVVSANAYGNTIAILFGDGKGGLSEPIIYDSGVFPLAVDLGDLDGDGDLDMVTSQYSSRDWIIFENDGLGNFTKASILQASEAGSCAILHDRDNSGDLDITAIDELSDELFLFDNVSVATNDPKSVPIQMEIFPNPTANQLNVELTLQQNQAIEIKLINLLGQVEEIVYTNYLVFGQHSLQLEFIGISGLYFLQIQADNWTKILPIKIIGK